MSHWDVPPWDVPPAEGARGRHSRWDDEPERPVSPAPSAPAPFGGLPAPQAAYPPPHRPVSPLPHRPVSPPPQRPVSPAPRPVSGPRLAPTSPSGWHGGARNGGTGSRSHWVDEYGVDHRGRQVIDADDVYPDEDPDDSKVNRRRALLVLGGVVGGAAVALAPQGFNLAGKLFGGPADTDGPLATSRDTLPGDGSSRPAGKQASSVRTYTEQNDSYMGSTAGDAVRKNTPQKGTVLPAPAQAAASPQSIPLSALGADPVRHLASRLTFGPTPKLIADITRMGIDQWIAWQLEPERIPQTRAEAKLSELSTLNKSIEQLRTDRDADNGKGIHPEDEVVEAAIARQIWSDRQVLEVMVDFWNDFLHVAASFDGAEMVRSSFDRDVIRKYALDNYPDMLVAANRHPALLRYLSQDQSRKDAVNENLARENLELFSVGVDGGYTEKDVRQAALLQTGRGIRDDQYVYRADQHYVGPVTIMGFSHPNATAAGGEAAAEEYFRYLAMHPSTARYIATNLATRLVSDTPPATLIDQVAASYLANKGQIKPTLITLLSSTQFWGSVGQKVRRPMEYLVSTYRTLGVQADTPAGFTTNNANVTPFLQGLREIRGELETLGQFPTGMPTPNGYPDVFVAWTSAGTMLNLWNEALNIIEGRRPMFTYVNPEQLLGTTPPATAGAYVDALTKRLVYSTFTPRARDLILSVAGVDANTPVNAAFNGAIRAVARAILASPQQHLR